MYILHFICETNILRKGLHIAGSPGICMFIASFLCDRPGKAVTGNANTWLKVIYIQENMLKIRSKLNRYALNCRLRTLFH